MIVLIDNYDSFVYNIARYCRELDHQVRVVRNDQISIPEIKKLAPKHIIISPGPCTPNEAGISNAIIKQLGPQIPILGICLGHQCIGQVFGGQVVKARRPMHGKTSLISHTSKSIFSGLPNPLRVTRYHSLVVQNLPETLEILATFDDEIMAIAHRSHPIIGVQFHPEAVLTQAGHRLLYNFLSGSYMSHKAMASEGI
jgi:anthranilate synthase/aminodeoxychorismate synthase-like glutamine amidotransferase